MAAAGSDSTSQDEADRSDTEQPEVVSHIGPLEECPRCRGRDFIVGESNDAVVFRCLGCVTSWRYELGYVWETNDDPGTFTAG
jgi:hypothetical protein